MSKYTLPAVLKLTGAVHGSSLWNYRLIELVPASTRGGLSLREQGELADLVKLRKQVKAVTSQYP
jgi:hypothetical protein